MNNSFLLAGRSVAFFSQECHLPRSFMVPAPPPRGPASRLSHHPWSDPIAGLQTRAKHLGTATVARLMET
ncbi:uncharacterized protein EI97DRAFT_433198 [Westerdykella ornata]|uniref:Uncharacterized protein n=1 Tax=Westerdykella ornata TaxID=318751 RepID=A0A6A6JIT3_WESOR|nr:uncharacterized protein EI97DRAFT_433198 [Westerdykella ornata]KAF2276357.1 hypothetical protein EI97DRAFT_433198 [Westerdykella ornata]